VAILLLIVVSPVIDYFWRWPEFRPQGLFFAATLLVAVFSIQGSRIVLVTGACLVLITLISVGLALGKPVGLWDYLSFTSFLLFFVLTLWISVLQLFRTFRISVNKLVGAICVYLLLGVIWSLLYSGLYALDTAAFSGVPESIEILGRDEWLYYSFVTLTTLGYGDIAPVSQAARTLSFMEAIVGQFYLAILVAGLVSAYLAQRNEKK
jgi:hypothetical protein